MVGIKIGKCDLFLDDFFRVGDDPAATPYHEGWFSS
jgi:hypothetical protein